MEESSDPIKLLDLPGQVLDKVVEVLTKAGIELPALILQLFLLALVLLVLSITMRPCCLTGGTRSCFTCSGQEASG